MTISRTEPNEPISSVTIVNMKSICKVAGLGGEPYRDGSYQYYTTTDVVANDPKGVGAFILASAERERGAQASRISIGSNRGASK